MSARSGQDRRGTSGQRQRALRCCGTLGGWLVAALCLIAPVQAGVFDVIFTDVTTRAFSVVWVSDEAAADATVRVYADADGLDELTGELVLAVPSAAVPLAHEQGIVKVDVSGLAADSEVYVQTETVTAAGTELHPPTAPFPAVRTALTTRKANAADAPIVNDLIAHDLLTPDGQDPAEGALVLMSVPGVSAYPVSAFVGQGIPSPATVADLNNLFEADSGVSAELTGGEVLRLSEYRGRRCPMNAQELVRFRRVPMHQEIPPITELEDPVPCFFADTVCDDVVDILDAQRVLNQFDTALGECAFNPDLDIVEDNIINILDVQSALNRLGEEAPFTTQVP